MANERWQNSWGATESTGTGGSIRLSLDGVTVEATTIEEARLRLAEGIRDQYDDDYGNALYQLWGFVREPIAQFEWGVLQYEALLTQTTDNALRTEINRKISALRAERARYRTLDANPPTFTTPPASGPGSTTTPAPPSVSDLHGARNRR